MSNPKQLQDLLKFAISHQNSSGGNETIEIDEDKKYFLDCVLRTMSVNVIEEFKKSILILQSDLSTDDEKCDALELIKEYIDNIDFANSFVKIEGADILINCIKRGNKPVTLNAIAIVAELSQNNTFCQQYFFKYNIVPLLIKYLKQNDQEVVANALYALSSLVKNFDPALLELRENDGFQQVINCLSSKSSRVFMKACFFIITLSSDSSIRDEFAKLGAFNKLAKTLRIINDYEADIEIALNAMSILMESPYCNLLGNANEHIVYILKSIITKNKNLPQCEEIVLYGNKVLDAMENVTL